MGRELYAFFQRKPGYRFTAGFESRICFFFVSVSVCVCAWVRGWKRAFVFADVWVRVRVRASVVRCLRASRCVFPLEFVQSCVNANALACRFLCVPDIIWSWLIARPMAGRCPGFWQVNFSLEDVCVFSSPKNEFLKYVWTFVFDKRIFTPGTNVRRSLHFQRGVF